jgi:hypothetical protein
LSAKLPQLCALGHGQLGNNLVRGVGELLICLFELFALFGVAREARSVPPHHRFKIPKQLVLLSIDLAKNVADLQVLLLAEAQLRLDFLAANDLDHAASFAAGRITATVATTAASTNSAPAHAGNGLRLGLCVRQ